MGDTEQPAQDGNTAESQKPDISPSAELEAAGSPAADARLQAPPPDVQSRLAPAADPPSDRSQLPPDALSRLQAPPQRDLHERLAPPEGNFGRWASSEGPSSGLASPEPAPSSLKSSSESSSDHFDPPEEMQNHANSPPSLASRLSQGCESENSPAQQRLPSHLAAMVAPPVSAALRDDRRAAAAAGCGRSAVPYLPQQTLPVSAAGYGAAAGGAPPAALSQSASHHSDDPYSFSDDVSEQTGPRTASVEKPPAIPAALLPFQFPKKRGRKPKKLLEAMAAAGLEVPKYKTPVRSNDPNRPRKKHDRFNGLSHEEISRLTLPDYLCTGLDIVFIGINPGMTAAYKGHHYAGPGNHFWKCLYMAGLITEPLEPEHDFKLLEQKMGFTNIVSRTTKGSQELTRREIKEGGKILLQKLKLFQPKIAVFNGKGIYEIFSGRKDFMFGKQPEKIDGTSTHIWVMPSSSARCAQLPRALDKVPYFSALKKFRDQLNGLIDQVSDAELMFEVPKPARQRAAEAAIDEAMSAVLQAAADADDDDADDESAERTLAGDRPPPPPPPPAALLLEPPVKKKRGRPRKIHLDEHGVPLPEQPRKPGRRPAQQNGEPPRRGRRKKLTLDCGAAAAAGGGGVSPGGGGSAALSSMYQMSEQLAAAPGGSGLASPGFQSPAFQRPGPFSPGYMQQQQQQQQDPQHGFQPQQCMSQQQLQRQQSQHPGQQLPPQLSAAPLQPSPQHAQPSPHQLRQSPHNTQQQQQQQQYLPHPGLRDEPGPYPGGGGPGGMFPPYPRQQQQPSPPVGFQQQPQPFGGGPPQQQFGGSPAPQQQQQFGASPGHAPPYGQQPSPAARGAAYGQRSPAQTAPFGQHSPSMAGPPPFGQHSPAPAPQFGQRSPALAGPKFGQQSAASNGPMFGQQSPATNGPSFGQQAPHFGQQSPAMNSQFGQRNASTGGPQFGHQSPVTGGPQYGQQSPSTGPHFGQQSPSTGPHFGQQSPATGPLYGQQSPTAGHFSQPSPATGPQFGQQSPAHNSQFGQSPAQGSQFGQSPSGALYRHSPSAALPAGGGVGVPGSPAGFTNKCGPEPDDPAGLCLTPPPTSPSLGQPDFEAPASMPASDGADGSVTSLLPKDDPTDPSSASVASSQPSFSNPTTPAEVSGGQFAPGGQQPSPAHYPYTPSSQPAEFPVPQSTAAGTAAKSDMATKSLSDLESLVDQIPSLSGQERGPAPPPELPAHLTGGYSPQPRPGASYAGYGTAAGWGGVSGVTDATVSSYAGDGFAGPASVAASAAHPSSNFSVMSLANSSVPPAPPPQTVAAGGGGGATVDTNPFSIQNLATPAPYGGGGGGMSLPGGPVSVPTAAGMSGFSPVGNMSAGMYPYGAYSPAPPGYGGHGAVPGAFSTYGASGFAVPPSRLATYGSAYVPAAAPTYHQQAYTQQAMYERLKQEHMQMRFGGF